MNAVVQEYLIDGNMTRIYTESGLSSVTKVKVTGSLFTVYQGNGTSPVWYDTTLRDYPVSYTHLTLPTKRIV